MSTAEPSAPGRSGRRPWLAAALGAALLLGAVLLVLLLRGGDDEPAPPGTAAAGATAGQTRPRAATPEELAALGEESGRPVYWAGSSSGRTYELTRTPDGSVYVRYLDRGVTVGDARPDFLTVGTYPEDDPLATVREAAERPGAQVEELERGALAVANGARPNSWYLATPDAEVLVEVFSPRPGRARELVRSGRIVPVDE